MSILPIAESNNWGLILVPTKRWPFCVMSKIGHNSPANCSVFMICTVLHRSCVLHLLCMHFSFGGSPFECRKLNSNWLTAQVVAVS